MSAVIHRAVASPAVPRSQSVGRRSVGSGTVTRPWLPTTFTGAASRSRHRSRYQLGDGTTSSSRKLTHGVLARRAADGGAPARGPRAPPAEVARSRRAHATGGHDADTGRRIIHQVGQSA